VSGPPGFEEDSHLFEQETLVRWIIGSSHENRADQATRTFVQAVQAVWPRLLAHARRELSTQRLSGPEIRSLVLEIWESVLRSVWKTLQKDLDEGVKVRNLENYLIGVFHHRFNRYLQRRRQRNAHLEFLPPEDLTDFSSTSLRKDNWEDQIQRSIQLEEVYAEVDAFTRTALLARAHGFSWSEIARTLQTEERNLIMRVQYAIRKVRDKFNLGRGTLQAEGRPKEKVQPAKTSGSCKQGARPQFSSLLTGLERRSELDLG
jgi:DNA-directed RNA polymerase specialized sigma24 family protein